MISINKWKTIQHRNHPILSKTWVKMLCCECSWESNNYMSFFFRKKRFRYHTCSTETKMQTLRDMMLNQATLPFVLSLTSLILASLKQSSWKWISEMHSSTFKHNCSSYCAGTRHKIVISCLLSVAQTNGPLLF